MNKENLKRIRSELIKTIDNTNINILDKVNLMININLFLDEDKYEENVKVLSKYKNRSDYNG